MTKYTEEKNHWNKPADTPIVYGEESYRESRPPYICDTCHKTLSRLVDRSGRNQSWYCPTCQEEYDPETELLRSESQLIMSEGPVTDPSVSYPPEPQLKRKKNEPRGTFKVLRDRGMNIVNYQERGWRKETYD